ncbi:Protein FAM92A1 [Armadillidium vulgare]|nr:Protein FAM92A1 [Armadillidium vulgare]
MNSSLRIPDKRDNRIEKSVVSPLSSYRKICQNTREELRESFDLRRKDINRKKALERTVSGNRFSQPSKQVITDGDSVIKKSEENLRKSFLKVEEKIDGFEEKKIEDLKNILLDFIKELRNALGFTNSRSDVMEHENEYNISPVILGPKKKQKDLNLKLTVKKLKVSEKSL